MEAELHTQTALSPVADNSDHIVVHKTSSDGVVTNHTQIKFSKIETMHGELSRATGVLAGGSRILGSADEAAPQRHRISRPRARRRHRQLRAPFTSSNNIIRTQVGEATIEVDTSSTRERFFNKEYFERSMKTGLLVVSQMAGSSEKLKNLSLCLLGAIFAVCAMEFWKRPSCKVKWKIIIFQMASNSTMLLALYLLLCILKPEWLSWCGFVIVCIIAIAFTCFDELNVTCLNASALYQDIKTKFTWCCEKCVLVVNYVIDKVSKPLKDQASPASPPPHASV